MWQVPQLWQDGEAWILGGGPSLAAQFGIPNSLQEQVREGSKDISEYSAYLKDIYDKHVIGVNMAYRFGDWVDFCFFGDNKFFRKNRFRLTQYGGIKVTCHSAFRNKQSKFHTKAENIRYLAKDGNCPTGITDNPKKVSWNLNSGFAAISLAAHLGVSSIILVGFDMSLDSRGQQHWHGEYMSKNKKQRKIKAKPRSLPFNRHLRGQYAIAKDAKRKGIEILNANRDSAINQFKKIDIREVL